MAPEEIRDAVRVVGTVVEIGTDGFAAHAIIEPIAGDEVRITGSCAEIAWLGPHIFDAPIAIITTPDGGFLELDEGEG